MDTGVIQSIFDGFGQNILTDESKQKISEMIDSLVETRVNAKTLELTEKVKELEESESVLKEKEKILVEEAKNFARKLGNEFVERENVMFEEIENYRKQAEEIIIETCIEYRDKIEEISLEEAENCRLALENIVESEAGNYKKEQDAALAKEVKEFRESLVNKISEYMETELTKSIPQDIMEAAVENAAMRPLVEGMIATFGKNHIKLDSTSMDVIKEAKAEINKLTEAYNVKIKDNLKLSAKVRELEKTMKLESLTRGMTTPQKSKVFKLLESCSVDEIDNKFEQIKDIIITESVRSPTRVSKQSLKEGANKPVARTESVQRQLERINEETRHSDNPEMAQWSKTLKKQLKTG